MADEKLFLTRENIPDDEKLRSILGNKFKYIEDIRHFISDHYGKTTEEWKYYGQKNGWLLKKFLKKRNLFFISVFDGYFIITMVFGEKAMRAIEASSIKQELKDELAAARKYAEGTGLGIRVSDETYMDDIKILLRIKIEN